VTPRLRCFVPEPQAPVIYCCERCERIRLQLACHGLREAIGELEALLPKGTLINFYSDKPMKAWNGERWIEL
jgi:primosomal protein N'